MKRILSSFLLVAGALAGATRAQEIDVRLSIKFIENGSGQTPVGAYGTPTGIQAVIDDTNEALDRWGRGYRYVITEYQDVAGASQFFDLTQAEFKQLEDAAEANPVQYSWRTNATNVFIVNSLSFAGGAAAIAGNPPDAGYELVAIGVNIAPATGWTHELGHHFDLSHTHGAGGPFGDDGLADTKPDPALSCAPKVGGVFSCTVSSSNDECCCATKLTLLGLKGYTQAEEDDLLYNLMSYYGALDCIGSLVPPHDFTTIRLTNDQLDRWTDATRLYPQLQGEVSGFTYFVDKAFGGTSSGLSTNPYKTVATGISAASSGNGKIVLVRGGLYPENLTITTPITLRAAEGVATIGQ